MARSVVRSVRLDALRVGKAPCSVLASTVETPTATWQGALDRWKIRFVRCGKVQHAGTLSETPLTSARHCRAPDSAGIGTYQDLSLDTMRKVGESVH